MDNSEWPRLSDRHKTLLAKISVALMAIVAVIAFLIDGETPAPPQPAPTPTVSAPAALPPDTGIDGQGIVADVPAHELQPDGLPAGEAIEGAQVVPDPGPGAVVEERGPPAEGVGGEVYVSSPAFKGSQRLNAGAYYPSGSAHWGWDVGIWRGTNLYAAVDGTVIASNDGVPNHPAGSRYAIPGSASNWILLCAKVDNRPAALYYQHLSPGLAKAAKPGTKVKAGDYLGKSGNTGNSTGDHLHLSSQYLRAGQTCASITQRSASDQRYDYLTRPTLRIFAPSKFWAVPPKGPVVSLARIQKVAKTRGDAPGVRRIRTNLGMKPTTHYGRHVLAEYRVWQKSLGYRGAAANGIPGCTSLKKLGKKGPNRFSVRC